MSRPLLLTLVLLLPSSACQSGDPGIPPPPPEANRMADGMAPTPFSAEQIRGFCNNGREYRFLIENLGHPKQYQIMSFGKGDAERALLDSRATDMTGRALGTAQRSSPTWGALQAHASFPEKDCQIVTDSIQGPAMSHECWVYRIQGYQEGQPTETLFCFAKDMPGPPILMEKRVGSELVSRMQLQETTRR